MLSMSCPTSDCLMTACFTTACLTSMGELQAFAPAWRLLWQQDPWAKPFQSPEWLLPWWEAFAEPGGLRAAVVRQHGTPKGTQDGMPVAFLPFYRYTEPESGERLLLLLGAGTSDYLDALTTPDCSDAALEAGLDELLRRGDWDRMVLTQLAPRSRLLSAAQGWAGKSARPFAGDACAQRPAVPIRELPTKIRRNAMYYRNRATRLGRLELVTADAENCAAIFESLRALHTARWTESGEPGVLADPRVLAWHRQALPLLLDAGLLRLQLLQLDRVPLGVLYSLVDPPSSSLIRAATRMAGQRTQYFYLTAFSGEHAELRPGTLLLASAIEHAAQEGVAIIDMLRGEEAYKQLWHLKPAPTCGLEIRRDGMYKDVVAVEGEPGVGSS